jgi:diadenosine tetraphosphate (Ap4A) HIT family hydrolase
LDSQINGLAFQRTYTKPSLAMKKYHISAFAETFSGWSWPSCISIVAGMVVRARIVLQGLKVSSFNVGSNCGESAGRAIFHAQINLILPRKGNLADPRNAIPEKSPRKRFWLCAKPEKHPSFRM